MILLLALLTALDSPPQEGQPLVADSLAQRERAERYLLTCRTQAKELYGQLDETLLAWEQCEAEAKRRKIPQALPIIAGERALILLEKQHPGLRSQDPVAYAELLLRTQADAPEMELPIAELREAWLRLLKDPSARQNLHAVRTVTVRVSPSQVTDLPLIEELLRGSIGDLGFKVALPDQASAADSAIMLSVSASQSVDTRRTSRMDFHSVAVVLESGPIRYAELERQGRPLSAQGFSEPTTEEQAFREAAQSAAQGIAQALLRQVVQQVFSTPTP